MELKLQTVQSSNYSAGGLSPIDRCREPGMVHQDPKIGYEKLVQNKASANPHGGISKELWQLDQAWLGAERRLIAAVRGLPSSAKQIVETQVVFHRLSQQMELASRAAESISEVIKRAQQSGA